MLSHLIRSWLFGLTLVGASALIMSAPGTPLSSGAWAKDQVIEPVCVMDNGKGRKQRCSAEYMLENPTWRASEHCYQEDGKGRQRPCAVEYKKSHK